ncbi:MAG TPA: hypothetical protein IGS40_07805 [Trichormus sp. M33_DOE_039]|nr:hypothetical protein [Trichormus sp. M33_DOE_039]
MGLYRGRRSLQNALLLLRSTTETGTDLVEPPAGSQLHKYWELATGKRQLDYTRNTGSAPGKLVTALIYPFSVNHPATDPTPTLVKFSNRAKGAMTAQIGSEADLNHATSSTIDPIDRGRKFRAATITIFNPTNTETEVTSQTLGRKYKKRGGSSYSYPFGNTATDTLRYLEVKADLLGKALAKNADVTVTFKPEFLP